MSAYDDLDDALREKVEHRLRSDLIAWFVTVAADGSPRAVPVWFFAHDGVLSIVSEPGSVKIANVHAGSPVLVHLNAAGPFGDEVVVLRGDARIVEGPSAAWLERFRDPYVAKYAAAIDDFGMTLDDLFTRYSTLVEFTPRHVLAW